MELWSYGVLEGWSIARELYASEDLGILGDAGEFGLGIAMVGGLIILASILPRYLIFPRQ